MGKYIFCILALLVQPLFSFGIYRKQKKEEAALNVPLVFFSTVYLVVQFFVFFKYLIRIPDGFQIYAYLIQAAILAAFILLELALLSSNRYIKRIDSQEKESIADFKAILDAAQTELVMVTNAKNKQLLTRLCDSMRYANPVTHPAAQAENDAIRNLIIGISSVEDETLFSTRCEQIQKLLEVRNIKNK